MKRVALGEPNKVAHQLGWAWWFTGAPVGNGRGSVVEGPVLAGRSASRPSLLALGTALAAITKTASGTPSQG